jgi:hypothetical protein
VYLVTWKNDFMFHAWLERQPEDSILIIAPRPPTCPSGRTFLWWLGDHFEESRASVSCSAVSSSRRDFFALGGTGR